MSLPSSSNKGKNVQDCKRYQSESAQDAALAPFIKLCRIISAGDGTELVHVTVTYSNIDNQQAHVSLVASYMNTEGTPLERDTPCILGDVCYEYPGMPGVLCRQVAISARMPAGIDKLVVGVVSQHAILPDALTYFQESDLEQCRDTWRTSSLQAELDGRYHEWFLSHRSTDVQLALQRKVYSNFAQQPSFSVVVPLYHTPSEFLQQMVASVVEQSYPMWELILVNSTPQNRDLAHAIDHCCRTDARIHIIELPNNLGITLNTAEGLRAATGDFVAFLDHDDVLEPDALYWYAKAVSDHPDCDLIYCDEDKLQSGTYTLPFFKPDWDQFLLETNNYVCHMLAVRKELLAQLPNPTAELDGAQDFSLTLQAGAQARKVYHVRRVLYHWRIHEASTAASTDVKQDALLAGKRALEQYAQRLQLEATVTLATPPFCTYHLEPTLSDNLAVSLVLYGAPTSKTARKALEAEVRALTVWPQQNLHVHFASCSKDHEAAAINAVVQQIPGEWCVLVPANASFPEPLWLTYLMRFAVREEVGVVAPRVSYPDGTLRDRGVVVTKEDICAQQELWWPRGSSGVRGYCVLSHQVSAVHGGCLVVKTQELCLHPLEENIADSMWDVDWCLWMRRNGKAVVVEPRSELCRPMELPLLGEDEYAWEFALRSGLAVLRQKWADILAGPDPFYNPNLNQGGNYGLS